MSTHNTNVCLEFVSYPAHKNLHKFGYVIWDRCRLDDWGIAQDELDWPDVFFNEDDWGKEQEKKSQDELRMWKAKALALPKTECPDKPVSYDSQ